MCFHNNTANGISTNLAFEGQESKIHLPFDSHRIFSPAKASRPKKFSGQWVNLISHTSSPQIRQPLRRWLAFFSSLITIIPVDFYRLVKACQRADELQGHLGKDGRPDPMRVATRRIAAQFSKADYLANWYCIIFVVIQSPVQHWNMYTKCRTGKQASKKQPWVLILKPTNCIICGNFKKASIPVSGKKTFDKTWTWYTREH